MNKNKYEVNFKRLALLLLPTFLRHPLIGGIIYAAVSPLSYIHTRFMLHRYDTIYRLTHNGQVCHLRAVLNDMFDPIARRITITDDAENSSGLILYEREDQKSVLIPDRGTTAGMVVNRRGFGGVDGFDFWINIPFVLQGELNIKRLNAIVNSHKLASKRCQINYI